MPKKEHKHRLLAGFLDISWLGAARQLGRSVNDSVRPRLSIPDWETVSQSRHEDPTTETYFPRSGGTGHRLFLTPYALLYQGFGVGVQTVAAACGNQPMSHLAIAQFCGSCPWAPLEERCLGSGEAVCPFA